MAVSVLDNIMGGATCIDGTRIPVMAIKRFHEDGYSIAGIKSEYPTLTHDQISEAINYDGPIKMGRDWISELRGEE